MKEQTRTQRGQSIQKFNPKNHGLHLARPLINSSAAVLLVLVAGLANGQSVSAPGPTAPSSGATMNSMSSPGSFGTSPGSSMYNGPNASSTMNGGGTQSGTTMGPGAAVPAEPTTYNGAPSYDTDPNGVNGSTVPSTSMSTMPDNGIRSGTTTSYEPDPLPMKKHKKKSKKSTGDSGSM